MDGTSFFLDHRWWTTTARFPLGDGSPAYLAAGSAPVHYAPEGRDTEPLTAAEIAAVEWTVENLPAITAAALEGVLAHYLAVRADPDGLDPEDLPAVGSVEELLPLLEFRAVGVHQVSRGGRPYVGLGFECSWEAEHGLGVLMHGTRVVEVGGEDTSFLLWMAEQDAERIPDRAGQAPPTRSSAATSER